MNRRLATAAITIGLALSAAAQAQVNTINSVLLTPRRFNDFPNSNLTVTNNYPAQVRFDDRNYPTTPGGFANQHIASFSATNGATKYAFQNQEPFDIRFNINLNAGAASPRKEAGFRFDTLVAGESFFFVTSDGEVAAFGGPLPFFSFGTSAYTLGTTATMEMIYRPAALPTPSTIEYRFNGISSGQLAFSNLENGFINGTIDGLYVQAQANRTIPGGDFADANFTNISVTVPAPASAAVLAMTGLLGARRRRRRA